MEEPGGEGEEGERASLMHRGEGDGDEIEECAEAEGGLDPGHVGDGGNG